MAQMTAQIQELVGKINQIEAGSVQKDREIQELRERVQGQAQAAGPRMDALVSKWAPDPFSGEEAGWRSWSVKFRSYVGAMMTGSVGKWMDYVSPNRGNDLTLVNVNDQASEAPAATLYSSLVATCEGKALVVIERADKGEGIEAWRRLLLKYEPQTKQTKVLKMVQLLNWDFKGGDLTGAIERFDRAVTLDEEGTDQTVADDIKVWGHH